MAVKKTDAKKTAAGGDAAASMAAAWALAEKKLRAAGYTGELPAGASEAALQKTEEALGVQFPEEFRAAYRLHDGGGDEGIFAGWELLSLEGIVGQWKIWKELVDSGTFEGTKSTPDRGVKDDWWNPRWIPFTYDGAGNHHCLDLDPAPGGRVGQIIEMWHDADERPVAARSLAELFKKTEWGEPE
jgi:cell wall assembly regulator SMI1